MKIHLAVMREKKCVICRKMDRTGYDHVKWNKTQKGKYCIFLSYEKFAFKYMSINMFTIHSVFDKKLGALWEGRNGEEGRIREGKGEEQDKMCFSSWSRLTYIAAALFSRVRALKEVKDKCVSWHQGYPDWAISWFTAEGGGFIGRGFWLHLGWGGGRGTKMEEWTAERQHTDLSSWPALW